SLSPVRRGRVVYETENSSSGNSPSRRRVSVVLPAPDGDETMARTPRRDIRLILFHVLDLLAHLLELGLGADDQIDDLGRGGFGAHRVELAAELLDEEVEATPDAAALLRRRRDQRAHLGQMALRAHDLLGDVELVGEDRDLLRDPRRIELARRL